MKKIIISLILVIALALGGLSIYVSTIDWNKYKTQIAAQIEKLTGKRVVFDGAVNLSFLPRPHLTAENIKIYNQNGEKTNVPLAIIRTMVTDLSVAPLLKGRFEIDSMTLQDAEIAVEFLPNGRLNWYSEISDFQRDSLGNTEVALNSVMLKNATVEIINPGFDLDLVLKSMNAEVTAQSLYGPYRIDGNFVKDGKPAGFALNLGTLSETFGTSINLVLTHPTTESYARFDGQVLSSYAEIEGNLSIESKNPAKFANEFSNQTLIPTEFDYPFIGSTALKINPQQLAFENLTVKYGESTAGSGNLIIPLKPEEGADKPQIEFGFELTDLDLMPLIGILGQQIKKYDSEKPYLPETDFDMAVDIKALKATCLNGVIRNFNLSFDLINDIINIRTLSGLLPGDTDLTLEGDIFENEKRLSYDFQLNLTTQDTLKLLDWLNLKPQTYAPSTYRSAQVSTRLSGNLQQIKIAPLSLTLDNNTVNGVIGVVRDVRTTVFAALQSEKINFDNYLPQLTEEELKLPLGERLKISLNKLSYLNKYDLQADLKLAMGVYNKTPFENLELKLNSQNGKVRLERLHIDDIASAAIDLKGELTGLGATPSVQNLKYSFLTENFADFRNKFSVPLPDWPLAKNAKKIHAEGILTGNADLISLKAVTNIDDSFLKSVYTGQLFNQNNVLNFKGQLELNTDFIKFLNSLGFNYRPKDMPTGIFTFKGTVSGEPRNWSVSDMDAFVSSNNFKGKFSVSYPADRPTISADITASRFEFDRLIYNPEPNRQPPLLRPEGKVDFLERPLADSTNINYNFYKTFDLNGHFKAQVVNNGLNELSDVSTDIVIAGNRIVLKGLKGLLNRGIGNKSPVKADLTIDLSGDPRISGTVGLSDFEIEKIGGQKYAIQNGTLKAEMQLEAPAHSLSAMLNGLNGKLSFDIRKPTFIGWNLPDIEKDLATRDTSDGLADLIRNNLESSRTTFDLIGAEINFDKGAFTVKDALMSAGDLSVDFSGNGNLQNFDIDLGFTLISDQAKDKHDPVKWRWSGSLTSPTLSLDISALTDKYDAYWQKIAEEKKTAEDARIKALTDSMAQTQEQVEELLGMINARLMPLIKTYAPNSSNAEIKSVYDSRLILVLDDQSQLELMQEKAAGEYTTEDIADMNVRLENMELQLNDILREVQENIKLDYQTKAGHTYKNIMSIYNNVQSKSENYQKTLDAYVLRLLQLNSLVVLDQDPKASDNKAEIEKEFAELEDLHLETVKIRDQIQAAQSYTEIEVKYRRLQELEGLFKTNLEKLNTSLENLFEYAKNLVRKEENRLNQRNKVVEKSAPLALEQTTTKTDTPADTVQTESPQSAEAAPSADQTPRAEVQPAPQPETPPAPLIKPVETEENGIISYSAKTPVSGSVTKSTRRITVVPEKSTSSDTPLLRPINEDSVAPAGTLLRKK